MDSWVVFYCVENMYHIQYSPLQVVQFEVLFAMTNKLIDSETFLNQSPLFHLAVP